MKFEKRVRVDKREMVSSETTDEVQRSNDNLLKGYLQEREHSLRPDAIGKWEKIKSI